MRKLLLTLVIGASALPGLAQAAPRLGPPSSLSPAASVHTVQYVEHYHGGHYGPRWHWRGNWRHESYRHEAWRRHEWRRHEWRQAHGW